METFNLRGSGPAAYEHYLVPILFRPLAQRLLEVADVRPDDRLLDVACGTGIVARLAAATGVECTGVDVNPEMLATASQLAPQVHWLPCDAADLALPDESYDVAVCQQGLQFMPDPVAALREMRRVLVPSGRIVVGLWRDLVFARVSQRSSMCWTGISATLPAMSCGRHSALPRPAQPATC